MMKAGIDLINFATADYYIDLVDIACARNKDVKKYTSGIGQEKMSIAPEDEDVVTLGYKAAIGIVKQIDKSEITDLIVATETSIDQSKSSAAFIHGLLKLPKSCRNIEFKHACYSGTYALRSAINTIKIYPKSKILIVCSDIAKYDLESPGEPTQGCGAVAMLVTANPRIIEFDDYFGVYSQNVSDFFRPNYRSCAVVDGKYSAKMYLKSMLEAVRNFIQKSNNKISDFEYFCYHLPFTKIAEKAHKLLCSNHKIDYFINSFKDSLTYNRIIGNSYSASLYISLISLLDHSEQDLANSKVAFFSYGSGAVAEFFNGQIVKGYQKFLNKEERIAKINSRMKINFERYLEYYKEVRIPKNGNYQTKILSKEMRYTGSENHIRNYSI